MNTSENELLSHMEVIAIVNRMIVVLGVTTDKELAEKVNVTPANVSAWRQRGTIPFKACLFMFKKYGISMDWLITGKGEIMRDKDKRAHNNDNENWSRLAKMQKVFGKVGDEMFE